MKTKKTLLFFFVASCLLLNSTLCSAGIVQDKLLESRFMHRFVDKVTGQYWASELIKIQSIIDNMVNNTFPNMSNETHNNTVFWVEFCFLYATTKDFPVIAKTWSFFQSIISAILEKISEMFNPGKSTTTEF